MDRRLTPATPRIAHSSLKGRVDVPVYTEGTAMRVALPVADLLRAPNGARERQLLLGAAFTVIVALVGIFGIMADRFDGGIAASSLVSGFETTQKARDDAQDAKLDKAIDLLQQLTAAQK